MENPRRARNLFVERPQLHLRGKMRAPLWLRKLPTGTSVAVKLDTKMPTVQITIFPNIMKNGVLI